MSTRMKARYFIDDNGVIHTYYDNGVCTAEHYKVKVDGEVITAFDFFGNSVVGEYPLFNSLYSLADYVEGENVYITDLSSKIDYLEGEVEALEETIYTLQERNADLRETNYNLERWNS